MRDRSIDEFMTTSPRCIDADEPITDAYRLMLELGCRHLPVTKDGRLVGIVSERGLSGLQASVHPVFGAMNAAYAVGPKTPLLQVAAEMAELKLGAAVIALGGEVLGIFTTNDALDALVFVDSTLLARTTELKA